MLFFIYIYSLFIAFLVFLIYTIGYLDDYFLVVFRDVGYGASTEEVAMATK